jgi:hypothetical protein
MAQTDPDHQQAAREADARRRLLRAGASSLPRPPWLHRDQPPSAVDLIRFAVWRSHSGGGGGVEPGVGAEAGRVGVRVGGGQEDLLAALALVSSARAEVDQAEAALLFMARAHGLSWSKISGAMGLGSPQAAQQRFGRVAGRAGEQGSA